MRFRLIVATLACLTAGVNAAPHRRVLFPEPSLVILGMAEGPDRLLWLATSSGLYRFDGFHYHKISAYPFTSARFVAVTRDGAVWAGGIEGLARSAGGRFEVVTREEVRNMAASADRVFARQDALSVIELNGTVRRLTILTRRDMLVDQRGKLWSLCLNPERVCSIDTADPDVVEGRPMPVRAFDSAIPAAGGGIWAANDMEAALIRDGAIVKRFVRERSRESRRPSPLLPGNEGRIWFLGDTIRALGASVEFRDKTGSGHPLTGLEDRRGDLWVARAGEGLVRWTRSDRWRRWFPEDYGRGTAAQVVRNGDAIFVATHAGVYRLGADGSWSRFSEDLALMALLALPRGEFLGSLHGGGVVRLSREGRVVERIGEDMAIEEFREIVRDGRGRLWAGSKRSLFRIEGQPGSLRLVRDNPSGLAPGLPANAADLEVDRDGRLWVGYSNGIVRREEDGTWTPFEADGPVTLIRSFALSGDDLWVAHRRAGDFSRVRRTASGWTLQALRASAGFGPVDTHFIKRDSRGWVWRGTPEGVYVSDGIHAGAGDWLHLHTGNGLASNDTDQFGFLEDADGSIWIAGADGVTQLNPDASWFAAAAQAPPAVTRLTADGRTYVFPEAIPASLPGGVRNLVIDVGGLDGPAFRDQPLRYRLLPRHQSWSASGDGTIAYSNLADDDYRLELAWAGGTAPAGVLTFRVGSGHSLPWTARLGLLAGASLLIPLVRYSPWYDRMRFRTEKAFFLLRRRYSRRRFDSTSSGGAADVREHTGSTLMGRYRLDRVISSGGFSVVYAASDLRDGGDIAIKILNRRAGGDDGAVGDRFAHEVAALRSVVHPGVVPILDSWITRGGEPCLAMPFLDGITLRAALGHGPLGAARGYRLLRQMGDALAAIHERGIVHRDLKPENIMLLDAGTDEERPVILDFGTAGLLGRDLELAATTLMAGSFHYMAPERLTGHYSAASDVFSLGVIVLEMLTGKRLSDLKWMFFDAEFRGELRQVLAEALPGIGADDLAERLAPAFDPEPRRRPTSLQPWTESLMRALVYAR